MGIFLKTTSPARSPRLGRAARVATAGTIAVIASAGLAPTQARSQTENWLDVLNAYRAASGLSPVSNDSTLQPGVDAHARYTSAAGVLQHFESPGPLFSAEGDKAGKQSVINSWTGATFSDRQHIDTWLTAPFHAVHLLEPRLQRVAFASLNNQTGPFPAVGVLNILGGLGPKVTVSQPIVFPGNGSVTPLTTFEIEYPNPLTSCAGYAAPAGLPLIAMFPKPIADAKATVSVAGSPVESCTIDTGFVNPDPAAQSVGRTLLGQKNGVIVIPKSPLSPGTTYDVEIVGGDQRTKWSFTAAAPGSALPKQAASQIAPTPASPPASGAVVTTTASPTPSTIALAKTPGKTTGKQTSSTTKRAKATTKKVTKK